MGEYRAPRATFERALRSEDLSHHVRIVPGWFHETLPPRGLRHIAMLRLDGDTFNGTYESLRRLYPLVVEGGMVYVDDVGSYRGAAVAVRAYFGRPVGTRIVEDGAFYYEAVWWRKGVEFARESLYF